MVWFLRIGLGLLSDASRLVLLRLRSALSVRAENLVLRRQIAQYIERGVKPRRVDAVVRISLALLGRLCDLQSAIVIVRLENNHPLAPYGVALVLAIQVQNGSTSDPVRGEMILKPRSVSGKGHRNAVATDKNQAKHGGEGVYQSAPPGFCRRGTHERGLRCNKF